MSPQALASCLGCPVTRAELWADKLSACMALYEIDTPLRQAAFLAQIGHESAGLLFVREVWGPSATQKRYEGRRDLGNTQPGDGIKFLGRSPIQITGRANYASLRDRLRERFPYLDVPDLEEFPELLEDAQWGSMACCDYWDMRKINDAADRQDFQRVSQLVNGGKYGHSNGCQDRDRRYEICKRVCLALIHQ